jgi:probable HAF family extracellular repeat protein
MVPAYSDSIVTLTLQNLINKATIMNSKFSNLKLNRGIMAIVILVCSIGGTSVVAQPVITNLGVLPGGNHSFASGISADGSTVIGYSNNGQFTADRAFRWTASGGMQDLGFPPGYSSSHSQAVSGNGSVIVGHSVGISNAWRWTNSGGFQNLGTLGGANSAAFGVSSDGNTVAGWSQVSGADLRPFKWTSAGGMVDIGTLSGGTRAAVTGVSGNGSYFAGHSDNGVGPGTSIHAVRWTPTGVQDLGTIDSSGGDSRAHAISFDGSVVVGWSSTNNGIRAFRWTESDGMLNLGIVPPAGTFPTSNAFAVSGDGQVIGGESNGSAFLWTDTGGMVDLKTWLLGQGTDLTGWSHFYDVYGLSFDGSTIAGRGVFNGVTQGYVINLQAVPEPGTGILILGTLAGICLRRNRAQLISCGVQGPRTR